MSDIDVLIETLKSVKCIPEKDLRWLCERAKDILLEEANVQPIQTPVTICGDIHGQFHDLLELFKTGGELPATNYIFMGDYVDRGFYSIETFELLLCYKVKYPSRVTLLRGNHESRQITSVYGFYDEIVRKYGNPNPWKYCIEVFDCLCISAVVDGKIFCIHAGLSPEIRTLDQINTIERRVEIPHEGPFCDLMWSDPEEIEAWGMNARGAGWLFGSKVTHEFNHLNGLEMICRSHQLVQDGFKFMFDKGLVTVWSAPNYCYRCGNVAAIMTVRSEAPDPKFELFNSVSDVSKIQHYRNAVPYFL